MGDMKKRVRAIFRWVYQGQASQSDRQQRVAVLREALRASAPASRAAVATAAAAAATILSGMEVTASLHQEKEGANICLARLNDGSGGGTRSGEVDGGAGRA
jgi:hypothetical protein